MERGALEALVRWLRGGPPPEPPAAGVEAERLVAVADSQRVAPLLFGAVAGREGWPEAIVDSLRSSHHTSFARGARQLELAGAVLDALEEAGIRALPLKGAALAEGAYESVADRPMADVDLLVLGKWEAAVETLEKLGLELLERADHAWTFRDPRAGLLELHHSVTSCPGLFPLDAEGLWQRRSQGPGPVRRRPAREDLLVQLAMHAAFQHALRLTLGQFLDFKRVVAAGPVDATRFRSAVEAAAAGPAVAASFAVAEALVGLDLEPELRAWVWERRSPALETWLRPRLEDPLGFLRAGPVPLLRVRWGLLRGRRLELVARTLAPRPPGRPVSFVKRLLLAVNRVRGLVWRWVLR